MFLSKNFYCLMISVSLTVVANRFIDKANMVKKCIALVSNILIPIGMLCLVSSVIVAVSVLNYTVGKISKRQVNK